MSAHAQPVIAVVIALSWLVLTGVSAGQVVLAVLVAWLASAAYGRLVPRRLRLSRPGLMLRLAARVGRDIAESNLAVARLILVGDRRSGRRAGFVHIPLELTDPDALAVLAMIVTATPGTAWIDHDPASGRLLLHVLDLRDADEWVRTIKGRYETPLKEIFR